MSEPAHPAFLYVVDTSFLIEIHKRYPRKTLPGIWKDLETLIRDGRVVAPEFVKTEINRQDDELTDWVNRHSRMFESITTELWGTTGVVVNTFPRTAHTLSQRPDHADPFVVGLAMKLAKQARFETRTIVVVAEEKGKLGENPALRDAEIEKIPDVCEKLGIPCVTHLEMFKREGFRFY
ncbi:MAG: DUF4411 family protein [Methanoregula sp.]|jgi:hypothetical protein|nr:DUF4411 family protein [Methanoregula sp.]